MIGGWIGVDLDGTLAMYDHWRGVEHIGEPIPLMMERVKRWIAQGVEVRIFTARACQEDAIPYVYQWCVEHIGQPLKVTNQKDYGMIELWDDRAVGVVFNKGTIKSGGGDYAVHPIHI